MQTMTSNILEVALLQVWHQAFNVFDQISNEVEITPETDQNWHAITNNAGKFSGSWLAYTVHIKETFPEHVLTCWDRTNLNSETRPKYVNTSWNTPFDTIL